MINSHLLNPKNYPLLSTGGVL